MQDTPVDGRAQGVIRTWVESITDKKHEAYMKIVSDRKNVRDSKKIGARSHRIQL